MMAQPSQEMGQPKRSQKRSLVNGFASTAILALVCIFVGRNIATLRYVHVGDDQHYRFMEQEESLHEKILKMEETSLTDDATDEHQMDIVHVINTR